MEEGEKEAEAERCVRAYIMDDAHDAPLAYY